MNECALDDEILSTPFVHSLERWVVITGAPCSGKSTLLEALRRRGHYTIPEASRIYTNAALKKGLTVQEVRANEDFTSLDPNHALKECFKRRYSHVFILDRLPVQLDGTRIEGNAQAAMIDRWLENDYRSLSYEVVRVPVASVEDRMRLILGHVKGDKIDV
eukprot:CFRG5344T1